MHRLLTIAKREWCAMVVTKAFLFTLIMMPILMFSGIVLLPMLSKIGGKKERRILVVDGSGALFDAIAAAADQRNQLVEASLAAEENGGKGLENDSSKPDNPFEAAETWEFQQHTADVLSDEDKLKFSEQLRDGSLYAIVEIPPDFLGSQSPQARFISQDALSIARRWLHGFLRNHIRTQRLSELGIDPDVVVKADVPVGLAAVRPYAKSEDGTIESKESKNVLATMFLPFGVMMLMFLVIFLAAQPMLESAMEEKSDRIAELLLGSVSPTELMTGKLIGNVAGSFVIFAIYGVGGLIIAHQNDWSLDLSWTVIPWLLLFQVLGVLFFSSIFMTIGASVRELKEAQSLLLPVWLVLLTPMMIWVVAIRDPNGAVPVALSFFPPSAPLMMSLRLAVGQTMPAWQAPLAALLMLVATAGVVLLAGRIYRASLLKSDSAKSFLALWQRLRSPE